MYDSSTADLIRKTPELKGLDRERLPEFFADVYTQISSLRMQLREEGAVDEGQVEKIAEKLKALSSTNEALVVAVDFLEHRSSAAFVGASSYQLLSNIERKNSANEYPTELGIQGISSDVSAMLLFLISESPADAREMAKAMKWETKNQILNDLILSLQDLAMGRLTQIRERIVPEVASVKSNFQGETATLALFRRLFEGVQLLARKLLSKNFDDNRGDPVLLFQETKNLSVGASYQIISDLNESACSFSGPHQLASLLVFVAGSLFDQAVINIPPPSNITPKVWFARLEKIARQRPYLWKNHTHAIAKGFLNSGTSAVIGFPTGSGKSTLSELKISSALLLGNKVVFLAPTHALVDQTTRSLRQSFPTARVQGERIEEFSAFSGGQDFPEVMIMTPEACLTTLGVKPEVFEDVGLLVFDECHLLHPSENAEDKRAVDSMLCLLNFSRMLPDLEFLLLSAMIKNANEIAEWLGELTSRPCLGLDLPWKPTRQLRGTLVYKENEAKELSVSLREAKIRGKTKQPSKADKEALRIDPLGMFSLKQTWATENTEDYRICQILSEKVSLTASPQWRLTPNSGEVSASISAAASQSGLKSLIFFSTIKNAKSAVDKVTAKLGASMIQLSSKEMEWFRISELELGGAEHLYLNVLDGVLQDSAAVHHGLLLPEERRLCESLFKRPDGLKILTATSTLAQGMNLPSELVIIAEDSQFDQETEKRRLLEARDLLNAAGRAGRAGENAAGIVLVIPGRVIPYNSETRLIGSHWSSLKEVFGQSDQCLTIDDPLTAVLDRVHSGTNISDVDKYTLSRLESSEVDGADGSAVLRSNVRRSFSGFRSRKAENEAWIEEVIESALGRIQAMNQDEVASDRLMKIVTKLGLPLELVSRLAEDLPKDLLELSSIQDWNIWFFNWMEVNPKLLRFIFRRTSLEELFGKPFKEAIDVEDEAAMVLPVLKVAAELWMKGRPFREVEEVFGTALAKLNTCVKARRFALRIVPTLSYVYGIPALLGEESFGDEVDGRIPPAVLLLSQCLRQGFDSVELLALKKVLGDNDLSRREIHEKLNMIKPRLTKPLSLETWEETLSRVRVASNL